MWLSVGGQLRARVEAYENGGFKPDNSDQYILTRILLNARVRPTNGTSLFVEGMDARGPWKNKAPAGPPFRDHADLRQLYLQLGADKSATMLRAGRLELDFGDGRLIGSLPWANTARTFDGARGMFSRANYRVDVFATSVVRVQQDKFDRNIPGNNFYGVYGSVTKFAPKAAVEPFVLWRRQSGLTSEAGAVGTMNFGTFGFRTAGKLPSNFDYDTQMALQHGSLGDEQSAPGRDTGCSAIRSRASVGRRDCSPSTTRRQATKTLPTTRRAPSISSIPPGMTSTVSPIWSAGRT